MAEKNTNYNMNLDDKTQDQYQVTETQVALTLAVQEIDQSISPEQDSVKIRLYALVASDKLLPVIADEQLATQLRQDIAKTPCHLSAIEQEQLTTEVLEDLLATTFWDQTVDGCAIVAYQHTASTQAGAEAGQTNQIASVRNHHSYKPTRITAGVLRNGENWFILGTSEEGKWKRRAGINVIPSLVQAMMSTLN